MTAMSSTPTGNARTAVGTEVKRRLMKRPERREQIIAAAKRAFSRAAFSDTLLDDVAREAGISKAILYRHFDSKADLYEAVLDDVSERLQAAFGGEANLHNAKVDVIVAMADDDPEGFRLLFEHLAREPEFSGYNDQLQALSMTVTQTRMSEELGDSGNVDWASRLVPALTIRAVLSWLDAGRPDRAHAAEIVHDIIAGALEAFRKPRR
ncbi:hypothetical protein GCM10023192_69760 [Amycolatopsis samaneae]